MSRILAYTSPARGHLFPAAAILEQLRARGHDVAVLTLGSEVGLMTEAGYRATAIDPAIEALAHVDYQASNPRDGLSKAVGVFLQRAEHDAGDLRRAIDEEKPDALLVDINCWGALAAAEAWGGPWAAFCPFPIFLSSPDAPPFGPGLAPARGPLGRLRDKAMRPLVMGVIEKSFLPALNRVRSEVGVPPISSADDMFLKPPLLIYMTAEPFEYHRREWPESVVMVGPCEWEAPGEAPAWLAQVSKPVVLVTTSSEFQDDGRLVAVALEALAGEPVQVVATLPAGDPSGYTVPANAHLEKFVSHGPVLDRAVCAITHGGMGATQKALSRGVPVCAVPFGRDQNEVARRVEVASAGSRLPAKKLSAERLRASVKEAMTRSAGARRVAAAFTAAGGPNAAADAFETRLLSGPPLGAPIREPERSRAG